MTYQIYNKKGKILRRVNCSPALSLLQGKDGRFIIEGEANDAIQKIEFDGFDEKGQPINPRIVDKTPEEIEADNPTPPELPESKKQAYITDEQWQSIIKRLEALEARPI